MCACARVCVKPPWTSLLLRALGLRAWATCGKRYFLCAALPSFQFSILSLVLSLSDAVWLLLCFFEASLVSPCSRLLSPSSVVKESHTLYFSLSVTMATKTHIAVRFSISGVPHVPQPESHTTPLLFPVLLTNLPGVTLWPSSVVLIRDGLLAAHSLTLILSRSLSFKSSSCFEGWQIAFLFLWRCESHIYSLKNIFLPYNYV